MFPDDVVAQLWNTAHYASMLSLTVIIQLGLHCLLMSEYSFIVLLFVFWAKLQSDFFFCSVCRVWKAPAVHNQSGTKKYGVKCSRADWCKMSHCCFNAENMCRDDAVWPPPSPPSLWDHMQDLWPSINSSLKGSSSLRCAATPVITWALQTKGKKWSRMMMQRRTAEVWAAAAGIN